MPDSPVFTRKGDNVEVEVPLTIPEALRGGDIEVPTLDGRKTLRVPAGTRPGHVQRLRGEGPKRFGKPGRGDIHYRFVLDLPASLTAEQEAAVDDLAKVFNGDPRAGCSRHERPAPAHHHDAHRGLRRTAACS